MSHSSTYGIIYTDRNVKKFLMNCLDNIRPTKKDGYCPIIRGDYDKSLKEFIMKTSVLKSMLE